ncbi:hypothetical protein Lepil_3261 [Leptonema illini DSM 21528]|uniref:Uncharacterized protein n=1 Tax=Leptonema illini DSM 21528 TaxID=929563 RepID=H2CGK5_9LEPT|nr:hypothetical protein Lepil_3261 [Leptonema illini DSM 21528]
MEMLSGWIKDIEASYNPEIVRSGRHWHSCSAGQLPVIQVIMQKFWFISVVD